jgi:transposase
MPNQYVVEHLNHLGIVAEVCREIGVADWLDQQEPTRRQQVSVGTATVAMVLNGLGFSNRQLYLVPQFFADKPVEHLLGPGIAAADLNDDCLGRTLDWLYAHDVTALFAGLAHRARAAFGVTVERLHADTTSFHVHGQYAQLDAGEPAIIQITYGYARDHRADLQQWMLAVITSGEGVPLFLQPLDGNASDKASLLGAVTDCTAHLAATHEEPGVFIADSSLYSQANITTLNSAGVQWVSRVPETSTAAQQAVQSEPTSWQTDEAGTRHWWSQVVDLPQGRERWLIVRTDAGIATARATLHRQAAKEEQTWRQRLWHVGNQPFACEADALAALRKTTQRCPAWIQVQAQVVSAVKQATRGRPRTDGTAPTVTQWRIQATATLDLAEMEREALRRAAFIIATNLLDAAQWPDTAILALYREQVVVERGFAFLKDPLFLASSVFLKKPERIMALAFIMVLCLLVYKLAEMRVRRRLAALDHTVPDQLRHPTQRPTMRWLFQCFEGIDLHHTLLPDGTRQSEVLRLEPLHQHVLQVLGPAYETRYMLSPQTVQ